MKSCPCSTFTIADGDEVRIFLRHLNSPFFVRKSVIKTVIAEIGISFRKKVKNKQNEARRAFEVLISLLIILYKVYKV